MQANRSVSSGPSKSESKLTGPRLEIMTRDHDTRSWLEFLTRNWWLEILIRDLELEMQFEIQLEILTWRIGIPQYVLQKSTAFLLCVFQTYNFNTSCHVKSFRV